MVTFSPADSGPYPCRYRDGKSSRTYEGNVTLFPDVLKISYQQDEWLWERRDWPVSNILRADLPLDGTVELHFGRFPHETLVINCEPCIAALRQTYGRRFFKTGVYVSLLKSGKRIALAASLALTVLGVLYFFGIPLLSDLVVSVLPPSQEVSIGRTLFNQVTEDLVLSESVTPAVNQFAAQLDFGGATPEIRVFKNDEVNAFAIMGGYIGIYEPILALLDTPEELAGLLAHEYAHIEKRHSSRLMFRALSGYLIISAMLGDFSGLSVSLVQNADMINTLRYSRAFEAEADERAVEILKLNDIEGVSLVNLLEKFSESGEKAPSEWVSSHPDLLRRIEAANTLDLDKGSSRADPECHARRKKRAEIFLELRSLLDEED